MKIKEYKIRISGIPGQPEEVEVILKTDQGTYLGSGATMKTAWKDVKHKAKTD